MHACMRADYAPPYIGANHARSRQPTHPETLTNSKSESKLVNKRWPFSTERAAPSASRSRWRLYAATRSNWASRSYHLYVSPNALVESHW